MTHMLPPHHQEPGLAQSYQPTLQMDPNQPPMQPQIQAQQTPATATTRKRKKADPNSDEPQQPAEPRRLRRSHEACARCRSKKIKASPVGRHRRQIPVLSPRLRRLNVVLICPPITVRLQTSKMYCMRLRRRTMPPRRQTQTDSYRPRPHGAHRASTYAMCSAVEATYTEF